MKRSVQHSVAVRTTLLVVLLTCTAGALFAMLAVYAVHRREMARLERHVSELALTVESTVRIAAYVADRNLAKEIANGILKNQSVAAVRITSGGKVLYQVGEVPAGGSDAQGAHVVRSIASPFDDTEHVGELVLVPSTHAIHAEADTYAAYLGVWLTFQALALSMVVAVVVLKTIVRPIKNLSDELHRLQAEHGEQLAIPYGYERNEIGRLAGDVNTLIGKLVRLLSSERQQRIERERSERQLRLIFEKTDSGIFTIDASSRLVSWNPALARELGFPAVRSAEAGAPHLETLLAPHGERLRVLIDRSQSERRVVADDFEIRPAGAAVAKWLSIALQPIETNLFQGIMQDVTVHKRAEADAQALAQRDVLTGLLNRRGMEYVLGPLFAHWADAARSFTLMMLDLDWFKEVNDAHGHDAGDEVLRIIAKRLQASVRPVDTVARLGGDEFVLILSGELTMEATSALAQRVIDRVSETIVLPDGASAKVGASIGIASVGHGTDQIDTLLHAADLAMYASKQAGRSRATWAGGDDGQRARR